MKVITRTEWLDGRSKARTRDKPVTCRTLAHSNVCARGSIAKVRFTDYCRPPTTTSSNHHHPQPLSIPYRRIRVSHQVSYEPRGWNLDALGGDRGPFEGAEGGHVASLRILNDTCQPCLRRGQVCRCAKADEIRAHITIPAALRPERCDTGCESTSLLTLASAQAPLLILPRANLSTTTPSSPYSAQHRQDGSHLLEAVRSPLGQEGDAYSDGRLGCGWQDHDPV